MLYAHTTSGIVDQVGQPPALAYDGARWWDLRDLDPQILTSLGWLPVIVTAQPGDTPTRTTELGYEVGTEAVTQVWIPRGWTTRELEAKTATVNEATIQGKAKAALTANDTFLALTSPTNAQVLAQTKILTRECSALIRLALRLLGTTAGT